MKDKLIAIIKEHLELNQNTGIIEMMRIIYNCIYQLFNKRDES